MSPQTPEEIIARIKDRYGDQSANMGSEEPPVGRISTRSLELDYATGRGIPIGRWSRFYGPKSSGKSIKCLHIIAEAQSMGMTCAYYNAEKQFTDDFARKQGVDTDKLILIQGSIIEQIGEIMEGNMEDIDLHVVDSCSQSITRTELADGLNEREYFAIRARKWGQQFAFINERFDQNRNTIVLVDQVRTKIGGGPQTVYEPPGGKMMEHVSSMTVEFKPGSMLWYDKDGILGDTRNTKQKTLSGGTEADGVTIQATVRKSRVSRPFLTARMKFDYNTLEFDWLDEYVKAAKYFGVADTSSKGWIKVKDEDGNLKNIRPNEFRNLVLNDPELAQKIKDSMYGL